MQDYAMTAVVAYLLGSIPFGYILVRIFRGADIRQTGSGNIGATNVARSGAKGLAIATLILDAAKGFFAVRLVTILVPALNAFGAAVSHAGGTEHGIVETPHLQAFYVVAALFAIIGHVFPIWLKFKGGKGVATGAGAFLALAPTSLAIVLAIFAVIVIASRYVSLGSIVATAVFPVLAYFLGGYREAAIVAMMCFASLLIILKHKDNIRRLLSGTEHRFGDPRPAGAKPQ
jgi:glycerol-3-phosphate acyltransferase PlsY